MADGGSETPRAKRAKRAYQQLKAEYDVATCEAILEEFPIQALDLQERAAELFPYQNLQEAEDAFRKDCIAPEDLEMGKQNEHLRRIIVFLRHELDVSCQRLTRMETFLKFRTPKIEDGNNFGVEIQKQFLSTVQDYRSYCWKELCALKNNSFNRAVVMESMELVETEEKKNATERKPDPEHRLSAPGSEPDDFPVTTTLETLIVRRNRNKFPAKNKHYLTYVVDLDVEAYFKLRHTVRNLSNYFADTYDFFEKNREKILFPRGDKGEGPSNMMY